MSNDYTTVEGARKVLTDLGNIVGRDGDEPIHVEIVHKAVSKIPPEVMNEVLRDPKFSMNLVADLPKTLPPEIFNKAIRSGLDVAEPGKGFVKDLLHHQWGNPKAIDPETAQKLFDKGHGPTIVESGSVLPPGSAELYFSKNPDQFRKWFRNGPYLSLKGKIDAAPQAFDSNLSDPRFAKNMLWSSGEISSQQKDKVARAALSVIDPQEGDGDYGDMIGSMTPDLSHDTIRAYFDKGFGRDILGSNQAKIPSDILETHFERLKGLSQRAYIDDVTKAMKGRSDIQDHRITDAYHTAIGNHFATWPLLAQRRAVPKDLVNHILNSPESDDVTSLASNASTTFEPEQSLKILHHPGVNIGALDSGVSEMHFRNAHDLMSQEQRRAISERSPHSDPDNWHSRHWRSGPEPRNNQYLDIKNGTSRLRRLRDHIVESGQTELSPKDFPPDLKPILQQMPFARTKAGNISADLLQQAIDKTPHTRYNYSHSEWDGVQRHSKEESNVFRLDATTDQLNQMHKAGVLNSFRNLQEISSGHPVNPNSIGWVRYTGDPQKGIFIDEIQSDHAVPLARKAAGQAKHEGRDEKEAYDAANERVPEEHQKVINQILFGGVHPNRVVAEGFLQHFRDQGLPDTKLHIHSVETKAPISLGAGTDPKSVPIHMKETYDKLPKEWGMKPAKYGTIETETNPKLKDSPIHEGKVRKAEEPLEIVEDETSGVLPEETSEVRQLLCHADPQERLMALMLDSVTPEDLAFAILDPDAEVFASAFHHPRSGLALDVLAAATRDRKGGPIWDRHDLLMKDPRCCHQHLESIRAAIESDPHLPIDVAADRVGALPLHKKIYNGIDPDQETTHPAVAQEAASFDPSRSQTMSGSEAGFGIGATPKIILKQDDKTYIKKPYSLPSRPLQGWAEATSQDLYHTAGIGDLHQMSWVRGPSTVILTSKAEPIHRIRPDQRNRSQAQRVAVMDFLSANGDRNPSNLMHRDNSLYAIDHGDAFQYTSRPDTFDRYATSAVRHADPGSDWSHTLEWWRQVSPKVRSAFEKRLKLLSPDRQQPMRARFNERADFLDKAGGQNWQKTPHKSDPLDLLKSLGDADFLHKEDSSPNPHQTITDHTPHLRAPESLTPDIHHYETHLNGPTEHKPIMGQFNGIEPKAVYRHGANHYLVKPAGTHISHGSFLGSSAPWAWNEMTSQDLYHTAGIGDLHQKVHISSNNGKPALVIHMHPGLLTADQTVSQDDARAEKIFDHKSDLSKIHLMDYVLGNTDRHGSNLGVTEEGRPLAIDNGLSLAMDHSYAVGDPYASDLAENNIDHAEADSVVKAWGGNRNDPETLGWWDSVKDRVRERYHRRLDEISDQGYASKLREAFDSRFGTVGQNREVPA